MEFHVEELRSLWDLIKRGFPTINQIKVGNQWILFNISLVPGFAEINIVRMPKKFEGLYVNINEVELPYADKTGTPVINVISSDYVEEHVGKYLNAINRSRL